MRIFHATRAARLGLRGDGHFPADPGGAPEYGCHRPSAGRGSLLWAVVASMLVASGVAFGGPVPTSYIYGIDDDSKLWVMTLSGTASGTSQLLGTTTLTGSSANGLAYDNVRQQLYGVDTNTDELYWWQQGAPTYTSLGSIATFTAGLGRPVSAAYYNNAYWFLGEGATGNQLGKLELTFTNGVPTGVSGTSFTIVGMPTAASGGGDMVITPGGALYAFSAPGPGNFFSVDVTTAASGTVGGYTLITTSTGTGLQLALGIDETTLYGHDRNTGSWYTVDTSNGSTTQIPGLTTLPTGKGFNDLGGSSIQAVPEPSTLALAVIGGVFVTWQMSRRRKAIRGPGEPGGPDTGPPPLASPNLC